MKVDDFISMVNNQKELRVVGDVFLTGEFVRVYDSKRDIIMDITRKSIEEAEEKPLVDWVNALGGNE